MNNNIKKSWDLFNNKNIYNPVNVRKEVFLSWQRSKLLGVHSKSLKNHRLDMSSSLINTPSTIWDKTMVLDDDKMRINDIVSRNQAVWSQFKVKGVFFTDQYFDVMFCLITGLEFWNQMPSVTSFREEIIGTSAASLLSDAEDNVYASKDEHYQSILKTLDTFIIDLDDDLQNEVYNNSDNYHNIPLFDHIILICEDYHQLVEAKSSIKAQILKDIEHFSKSCFVYKKAEPTLSLEVLEKVDYLPSNFIEVSEPILTSISKGEWLYNIDKLSYKVIKVTDIDSLKGLISIIGEDPETPLVLVCIEPIEINGITGDLTVPDFCVIVGAIKKPDLEMDKCNDDKSSQLTPFNTTSNKVDLSRLENMEKALAVASKAIASKRESETKVNNLDAVSFLNLSYKTSLKALEGAYIQETLNRSNGNKSEVAKILGISRATLYRKMKEHQIDEQSACV